MLDSSSLITSIHQPNKMNHDLQKFITSTLSTSIPSFSTTSSLSVNGVGGDDHDDALDSQSLPPHHHHPYHDNHPMNNLSLLLEDSAISLSLSPMKDIPSNTILTTTTIIHMKETSLEESTQSSSTKISLPQNHVTIDQGVTYVHFSREEDRQILMTARMNGDDLCDVWSSLIASGGTFTSDKSLEHIWARYRQLSSWMSSLGYPN